MKESLELFIISTLTVLVGAFTIAHSVGAVDDYVITVDNSNMTHSQSIIFDEKNIGPGFKESYNIRVDNQSSTAVEVSLEEFAEDPSNTLNIGDLHLTFSYNDTVLISTKDSSLYVGAKFICVGPQDSDLFKLDLDMDPSLGNAHQGHEFRIDITFRGNASDCESSNGNNNGNSGEDNGSGGDLPKLPNTGEGRGIYRFLCGGIALFAVLTVLFLVLFLVAKRKRRDEDRR